jgi:hypothetical protein
MTPAARLSRMTRHPTAMCRPTIALNPPERVGIPLADAENHYVTTCHDVLV